MNYSKSAFEKAENTLEKRRADRAEELNRREEYVYEKLPEVREMRASLSGSYYGLMKIIAAHEENAAAAAEKVRDKNLATQQRISLLVTDLTGDPEYLEPPYTCGICRDTGYVHGIRCECMENLLRRFTVEELNESSTIALHDFSQFRDDFYREPELRKKMNERRAYLENYCAHFPKGCRSILFSGRTGLGKTFLSSCIAKSLAERGFIVAIGSASDYIRAIENEHFGRSEGSTYDTLIGAELLILDDLGSEFRSPFSDTAVYDIVNGRLNLGRPTVISTNLSASELHKRYNERIASRILNEYLPFLFEGTDIRQQKAQELYTGK